MQRPKAIIFDLDGVLTDTSEYHYQSWKRLADEEGIPFTRQENDEHLRGVSRAESLTYLLKGRKVSDAKFQELMDRKNRYYHEMIKKMTPKDLVEGGRQLLEEIRQAGIKIAVASGSKNAHTVLDLLQIMDILDAVADGYSVSNSKPAPDIFVYAAGMVRIPLPRAWSSKMLMQVSRVQRPGGCRQLALVQRNVFIEQTKCCLRSRTNICKT